MSILSQSGLGLLLDHNRTTCFSGADTFFAGPLEGYVDEARRDLRNLRSNGGVKSYEDLGSYAQCFNLGSLIQYLLGDVKMARRLALCEIDFLRQCAKQAGCPEWNVQLIQPIINLARLARAVGRTEECVAILAALRRIAVFGQPSSVLHLGVDSTTARHIYNSAEARQVVENCYQMENLKCALATGDFASMREFLEPPSGSQTVLTGFKLEYLLKCELKAKSYARLLEIVSELPDCPLWVYMYVVDAFWEAQRFQDAHETAISLSEKVLHQQTMTGRNFLLYALALRLACMRDLKSAETIAIDALSCGESLSEVLQIRLGALLAIITASDTVLSEKRDALLWDALNKSRHNVERLIACTAAALTPGRANQYVEDAMKLAKRLALELTVLKPTVGVLMALAGAGGEEKHLKRFIKFPSGFSLQVGLASAGNLSRELFEIGDTAVLHRGRSTGPRQKHTSKM